MVAVIRAECLARSFGATVALRPLDLEVAESEVLGCLGLNGAGKTTTITCGDGAHAFRARILLSALADDS
jgi:ABC-2 type transport system ATP-binding protein